MRYERYSCEIHFDQAYLKNCAELEFDFYSKGEYIRQSSAFNMVFVIMFLKFTCK